MENSLINEATIYSIAFLVFCVVAFKTIKAKIFAYLRSYTKEVTHKMDDANSLLKEALSLFAQAERDLAEAKETADQIIEAAQKDASSLIKETKQQLVEVSERKTKIAMARIAMSEKQVLDEIKNKVIDGAFDKVNQKLLKELNHQAQLSVINHGFAKIKRIVN